MGFLPVISGRLLVKLLSKEGWCMVRQRGSHMILVKEGELVSLSVPDHRELAKGTLRSLLRSSGVSSEEFLAMMRQ